MGFIVGVNFLVSKNFCSHPFFRV